MSTEVGTLQASLNLDIRSFAEGISEAVNLARSLGNTLKDALGNSQGFSSLLREAASVREEVERLRNEVKALNAELNQARAPEAFTQVQQHTSRLRDDLASAASATGELSNVASGAETAMSGVSDEAQETYMLLNTATGEITELSDALRRAMGSTESVADAADDVADNFNDASKAAKKTADSIKRAFREVRGADRKTNRLSQNLKQASTFAKDLKRIIAGIVVSQAFYEILNVVNSLVRGSLKFANNMDQAQIAFKYLLGDVESASAMIENLQDFTIASPLDTSTVMASTRKLMAMGFTAKSVIPTMQVLADTAAVFTGDAGDMADMISHITLALGQMRASGKVMTQELRQLYNAGVPVFQILQEELDLTADQVRNIGKQSIDSGVAVMALLKGLQKRYSGAAKEFTQTIPGALAVIKDSIFVLYSELSKTPQSGFKEWINGIANSFKALVVITRAYGPGGFMQALFPLKLHKSIRNIVGALQQLGRALAVAGQVLRNVFGTALGYIVRILGWILPPIFTFVNALTQVIKWIYTTVPFVRQLASAFVALLTVFTVVRALQGLWVLLKLGKVVEWFRTGIVSTVKAIYSWVRSLVVAAAANWQATLSVLALIAVLALIVANSDRAKGAITRLFDAFKNLGVGFNGADILQPEFDPGPAEDFDGSLNDIITDLDDIGDSADKTNKKLKKMFNQSFDEVFLIDPSQDDALDGFDTDFSGILSDMDELLGKMDELALTGDFWKDWGNISDFFNLETPDFMEYGKEFMTELGNALKDNWALLGLGALVAMLLKGALKDGFKGIGKALSDALSTAGIIAGSIMVVWTITNILEEGINIKNFLIGALGGALTGAGIGWKVGGLKGALIGVTIGMGVSILMMATADMIFEKGLTLKNALIAALGGALTGAGIGWKIGGPKGALIGATIGISVSLLVTSVSDMIAGGELTVLNTAFAGLGAASLTTFGILKGATVLSKITPMFEKFGYTLTNLIPQILKVGNGAKQSFAKIGAGAALAVAGVGMLATSIISLIKDWEDMDTKTRILTIAMGALGAAFIALGTAIALGISTATLGIGAIIAAIVSVIAAIAGFIAKIASEENATVDVTTATERYNDALEEAKIKADELTMAEDDLTRAKKELTEAASQATSAIDTYERAVKRAEETSKALAEAERAQGITGAALHEQVMNGTLVYTNMTDAQKKVYKAYMDNEAAQNALTIATEEVNSIKETQIELEDKVKEATDKVTEATYAKIEADRKAVMAGWDVERSLAKQEKNYESYRDKVVDAYQKGELAADEAHELISKAMTGMSEDVRKTFTEDLPRDIKDGLDPAHYETTGEKIGNWFKNVGNSMVSGFKDIFGIKSPSKVMQGAAEDIEAGLKKGISGESVGTWFSTIGEKMVSGFKRIFGIASPSKVMEGFGENINDGLFNGTEGMLGRIEELFNKVRMAAGDALGGDLNVNADFDAWFIDLLTSLEGWLQILGARLTSWWSALWNGLKVDLSADINVTTNTSGSTNLGRTTPMSGLPVDGGRDNGTFNNNRVSWDSDDNEPTSPTRPGDGSLVDNVTAGVVQALAPFIVSQNDADQLPPVYVGTLIADDRGLKELERKLRIIRVKEERRGG